MPNRVLVMATALLQLALPTLAADIQPDLLEAAKKGKTAEVETLLAKGADLEMHDKNGRTPLMLAAQYGRTATVKLLLAKGARPDARDARGWNAFMLALLAPSGGPGGVIHTAHDAILTVLPQPKRLRLVVDAVLAPGNGMFSSCFMRPEEMTRHIRQIRPDAMVLEAFQRFAATSGRDLIAIVQSQSPDADAQLSLQVEPGAACVQQSDQISLLIHASLVHASLVRPPDQTPLLEKTFGAGVKTGMRSQMANNASQHEPLYQAWAKSQAGPLYWGVLTALLEQK
jgi:Ankyrin repeats (3 copies)